MAGDVIKEFLVKLGFKIDDEGVKKFKAGIASATKEVTGLGLMATGAATAVTAAITKIAEQYEDLYFASVRTSSSAANLATFAYGSKAIGISADQAASSLENLNIQLKTNPGKVAALNMWGIQTAGKDIKQVYGEIIDMLAAMPKDPASQAVMYQRGALVGLNPGEIIQRIALRKEEQEAEKDHTDLRAAAGVSFEELTKKSHDYDQSLRHLEATIGIGWDQVANKFLPSMTSMVELFDKGAIELLHLGRNTDGWSSALLAVAAALGAVKTAALLLPTGLASRLGLTAAGSMITAPLAASAAFVGASAAGAIGAGGIVQDKFAKDKNSFWGAYGTEWVPGMEVSSDMNRSEQTVHLWDMLKHLFDSNEPTAAQGDPPQSVAGGGGRRSRGDRNNNPGNIEYGAFAQSMGAIGTDGRFAIFPTPEAGHAAMGALLEKNYNGLSLAQIQRKWVGNSDSNYLGNMERATGLGAGGVPDLHDAALREKLIGAMAFGEGSHLTPGVGGGRSGGAVVNQTNNVTINGAKDPEQTGAVVKRELASAAEGVRQAGTAIR